MSPFEAVLVANRGEIAVRVMQACKELGIEAVAVYSDTDEAAKHVRLADHAYHIGPSVARKSYLDQTAILEAASEAGVDAIHPGYGFLAENASFARAVEASEATWVGPPGDVIAQFGEKTRARQLMERADVPIVPGTTEPVTDPDQVSAFGGEHGYPVAIKADGGGGGRGIKIVDGPDEIEGALEAARREGQEYFDNPDVYLERFIENPRHIEVQVLADQHGNVRHLRERDCSVQRRHQKVIEETPSPVLDEETREAIAEAARKGADESDYVNAGTVEFLYEDGAFYFLEVNTRIQVEHTITEVVTGIDLVKWQLRIAAGEELSFAQSAVQPQGHAMELRVNAEDPANDFSPMPGELTTYRPPRGIGVRVDDGVDQGDRISPFYDSMFAKFIVWGSDREEARSRGLRAIDEADIAGIPTTLPFHERVLTDETFVEGKHTTRYVDEAVEFTFE